MTYLDGSKDKVVMQMYRGRAMGVSFPTDGNRHNEEWTSREFPVIVDGLASNVTIRTYKDGTLIAIEIDLPPTLTSIETRCD